MPDPQRRPAEGPITVPWRRAARRLATTAGFLIASACPADALAAAICHGCTIGPAAEEYRIR